MAKNRRAPRGHGGRPAQVAHLVRQAIGAILEEGAVKDPRVSAASMLTITAVEMAPDLKLARVFVSVYPEDDALVAEVLSGLRSAVGHFKRELARRLELRFTPQLDFRPDRSMARASHVEEILKGIRHDEGWEP